MAAPEVLFQLVNLTVLPFWVLMIFLPGWRLTQVIIGSVWPFVLLPVVYAILLVPTVAEVFPVLLKPTLAEIAGILGRPEMALVGWVHFLALDLFVGRWIYLDSRRQGGRAWVISPILALTLMLGPCGLLVYLLTFGRHARQCGKQGGAGEA